jgi:glycosyltransferase involved in cell wall biosynthesis
MKIAFDLRRIGNLGVGRYMTCLVSAIVEQAPQHEYLFIMAPGTEHLLPCVGRGQVVFSSAAYYSFAEQIAIPLILWKHKVDLFHALHFVVPVLKVCPTIVTIHDTIHFIYPQDLPSWIGRIYAKIMMMVAAHVADRVLTVSEYSKSDIVRYLHVNPQKVVVTYALLDKRFTPIEDKDALLRIRLKLGITEDFLLYAGIFKARKNHLALLDAFALLLTSGMQIKLVIAGPLGDGERLLRQKASELGILKHVVFAGLVSDEELPSLYTSAKTYVCPSLYEGFGQTLIEAMACGTPVVSHIGSSLPEVCGDAALFADANNPVAFAAQMQRAIKDVSLQATLIQNGYKNILRFDSCKVARRTTQAYGGMLTSNKHGDK